MLKNILFDEILMVLFRSNQERCAQLIKKMCNLVCLYPTHKNIRVYCDSIERFFYAFKIPSIGHINTVYSVFIKCVSFFRFQLRGLLLSYLNIIYIDKNSLNIRKRSFLYRQSIRFRFFSITLRDVLRLFMK